MPEWEMAWEAPLNFDYVGGGVTPVAVGHDTGWRTLPFYVLVNNWGDSGSVAESRDRAPFRIAPGESYLVRRDQPHRLRVITGAQPVSIWCHFRVTMFQSVDLLGLFDFPALFSPELSSRLRELCSSLVLPEESGNPLAALVERKQTGFAMVRELIRAATPKSDMPQRLSSLERLAPVLDYMARHVGDGVTLGELAERAHFSVSRFQVVFQQALGRTPLAYHRYLRLLKAHELLIREDLTLEEIAARLGFYDVFHFGKQFKRQFGVSPGEYLKRHRKRMPGL